MISKDVLEISGFRCDLTGNSPAYYGLSPRVAISSREIHQLVKVTKHTQGPARICLHSAPSDLLHYMIIAQYRKFYSDAPLVRQFPTKSKIFQPLIGRILITYVSTNGDIQSELLLSSKDQNIARVEIGQLYSDLPVDQVSVHAEITTGPWDVKLDRNFPRIPADRDESSKLNWYMTQMHKAEQLACQS